MGCTVFGVLAAVSLIHLSQGFIGGPGIYGPITPEEYVIRQKIKIGQIDTKTCVRTASVPIKLAMSSAKNEINMALKSSRQSVAGGNAQCTSAYSLKLAQVKPELVKTCDQSLDLNAAGSNLGVIQSQLWICRMSGDATCFRRLDDELSELIENNKMVCESAPGAATDCINGIKGSASKTITEANEEFKICNTITM